MRFLLIKMSGVESKLQKEIVLCTIIPVLDITMEKFKVNRIFRKLYMVIK